MNTLQFVFKTTVSSVDLYGYLNFSVRYDGNNWLLLYGDNKSLIINMKLSIIIAAIIFLGILVIGGYLFYTGSKPAPTPIPTPTATPLADQNNTSDTENKIEDAATKGVLPDMQTNPLEEKPDLNPVDKTNPYKNIKTNPFK